MRVRLSRRAQADVREILRYSVQNWGILQGGSYLDQLDELLQRLASGERKGCIIDGLRPGIERITYRSHFLFYERTESLLSVVRILHQSMDARRHLG